MNVDWSCWVKESHIDFDNQAVDVTFVTHELRPRLPGLLCFQTKDVARLEC